MSSTQYALVEARIGRKILNKPLNKFAEKVFFPADLIFSFMPMGTLNMVHLVKFYRKAVAAADIELQLVNLYNSFTALRETWEHSSMAVYASNSS